MRRRLSRPVLLLTALAAAFAATGAGCAQTSYSCRDGSCEVSLSGEGATTEIDENVELVLVGADDGGAELSVAGERVTCAEGDTAEVSRASVTCNSVGDSDVDLTVELSTR